MTMDIAFKIVKIVVDRKGNSSREDTVSIELTLAKVKWCDLTDNLVLRINWWIWGTKNERSSYQFLLKYLYYSRVKVTESEISDQGL